MCRPAPIVCVAVLAAIGFAATVNVPVCPATATQSVIMEFDPNFSSPSKLSAGVFALMLPL